MKRLATHSQRVLVGLIWLSLASRIVVPAGFMPAAAGDGVPIKLCPGTVAGAHHPLDSAAHGEEPGEQDHEHRRAPCPQGLLFASAFLVADVQPLPFTPAEILRLGPSEVYAVASVTATRPRPRGPPAVPPSA